MGRISAALEQGQQKKLLALCDEALKEGYAPAAILSDGLIQGMNRLGDAFSANRAFVPEMLIAARCWNAVMERLKPLMAGEGNEPVGRACLGTVKGDMHDIGKNLVKIMMEGSGIEVIRPRCGHLGGEVRRYCRRKRLRHHRLLLAADDDYAGDAPRGRACERARPA